MGCAEFEATIIPHLNAARGLARWITRNSPDAEDLVQESCVKAFRFFASFHGSDGRGWLLAIVRNTCLSWLRRPEVHDAAQVFDERTHGTRSVSRGPEQMLIERECASAVRRCIDELPDEYRNVIVMRELQEMSYREIADAAHLPLGTIMSRLSRGRKRLETTLAQI